MGGAGGYVNTSVANRASFGARLGGHILDSLLYGLLASAFIIPGAIMFVGAFADCDKSTTDNEFTMSCADGQIKGGLLAGGIGILFLGIVVVAIVYLRALGRTGQTWGRKIVGVKVVREQDGSPLGFGLAFGRTVLEQILGQLCLLNYLWMLWDAEKQTWHDKIVHSVVIKA
ncbi:MAG: hypothetical protein RL238_1881 [Actinomycetota bacterium]|jgi:uncharacterized RDD family membrane protein YckC